jgi:hypothetical protein
MALDPLNGTERIVFGRSSVDEVGDLISRYVAGALGVEGYAVLFRAGRIDAVWAVRCVDGRGVVVRAHRPPVDLKVRAVVSSAQRVLYEAGFPCPSPLAGPDVVEGVVLSAETLMERGDRGEGREPRTRLAIVRGLLEHMQILREVPGLASLALPGPAWCRYQAGPWPVPHDTIFDFEVTPPGFEWLDDLAVAAAARLNGQELGREVVVGHADWYCGNLRFENSRLVAAFDWDLLADTEPVIVGMTAASYADSGESGAGLSSPADAVAFMQDYEVVGGRRFDSSEQSIAAAAASWVLAYNARCKLSLLTGVPPVGSILDMLRARGQEYLELRW